MRPEDMNTINEDGKAFNGNYFAVRLRWLPLALALAASQPLSSASSFHG